MPIVSLDPRHIEAVYAMYRRAVLPVPHCRFMPSQSHFAAALLHPRPEPTEILVAHEGGQSRGFAALHFNEYGADGLREAELTALFVDEAPAGNMLLDALSAHARDRGVQRLVAFPPHHFHSPIASYNAGWGGLSDRLGLVARLLARNGFTPFYRELHLEWTAGLDLSVFRRDPPGIALTTRTNPDEDTVTVALVSDEEAGRCDYSTLARISDDPEAGQWGYIWGLGVSENMRRRGIGWFLMNCALAQLSTDGCRGCWLTTAASNWPAQALYLALGFEVVDASTCFAKEFSTTT